MSWNFIFCIVFLVVLLIVISSSLFISDESGELKVELEGYECSFENLQNERQGFSIQFFIVGMSFMLFDLEICLFLPSVVGVFLITNLYILSIIFLLAILFIFLFELYYSGLSW